VDISYDIKYFCKILGGRKHVPSPTSIFGAVPSDPQSSPMATAYKRKEFYSIV